MDSAPDRYLHKKFKKQQSLVERIEPRVQDKENQKNVASRNVEAQNDPQDHHNHHYRQNYYHIVNSDRELSCFGGIVPIAAAAANHRAGGANLSFVPVVVHPQNAYKSSISNSVVSLDKGDVRTLDYRNSFASENCAENDGQFENISFVVGDRTDAPAQVYDVDNVQNEPATISSSILQYYPNGKAVKRDDAHPNSDHISEDVEAKTDRKEEASLPDKTSGGKYVCTYCNLVCSKPSVLQKHIRAHTNERPFPCTSCGFSFKTRSNLYKHCRSRTHANRVMGNKAQEISNEIDGDSQSYAGEKSPIRDDHKEEEKKPMDVKQKPYKPRFKGVFDTLIKENNENKHLEAKQTNSDYLSTHINELIHKNNSIVNSNDSCLIKKRVGDNYDNINNNEYVNRLQETYASMNEQKYDEPLNLTNKNRKRCLSEVTEPTVQKSLIKELLLKNLYADTNKQCQYCKMIFQTVTELDLHKLRSCKGFTKTGARYSRSSSVNVASILTQNKNAFDTNPHVPNTVFPLKSPGPFLGKTRLVESDKAKSFSFEDGIQTNFHALQAPGDVLKTSQRYSLSPLTLHDKIKRTPVKLFGGEVKITQTTGESKFFRIDSQEDKYNRDASYPEYSCKLSENRVVKSTLQSGGTVLQNKPTYSKQDSLRSSPDVIRVYDNASVSPNINLDRNLFDNAKERTDGDVTTNIIDFSQKAVKLFAPNLKQPSLVIPGIPNKHSPLLIDTKFNHLKRANDDAQRSKDDVEKRNFDNANFAKFHQMTEPDAAKPNSFYDPMKLVVGGKVFRHVPGIPGPIVANTPMDVYSPVVSKNCARLQKPNIRITRVDSPKFAEGGVQAKVQERRSPNVKSEPRHDEVAPFKLAELKSPKLSEVKSPEAPRKFARPNSLALKPSMSVLKQHHGLTPTMFNQILISPDTPRVAKKYNHQILHGNYFSYLGLKSSTKSVYCTLNKTQPFYVPHFKKLSMYSEWRQQDNKSDKLYVSAYDCRQRQQKYTMSGKVAADLIVHSSYKFTYTEVPAIREEPTKSILGGYESNEDYTYVRGRGRGRYVCDQCGIRCKKPSMLKKHIKTHSNDRPYTCSHCNFSFKTKGNLTKHMKSKAHTKNSAANSSSSNSSTQQSGTPSSESDTDDSGMDSSDESTRQQEHEAAYGLLSLSQKPNVSQTDCYSQSPIASTTSNPSSIVSPERNFMDTEQIAHVSKTNYAKNKILDHQTGINFSPTKLSEFILHVDGESQEKQKIAEFLGRTSATRPLTYPYTSVLLPEIKPSEPVDVLNNSNDSVGQDKVENIKQFNVIKRYGRFQAGYEIQPPSKTTEVPVEYKIDSPKLEELRPVTILVADSPQNVASDLRKRKGSPSEIFAPKIQKSDAEVMDLSMTSNVEKTYASDVIQNGDYAELPRNNLIDAKKNKEMINYRVKTYEQKEKIKAYYNNVSNECYRQDDSRDNEEGAYKKNEVLNDENNRLNYLMHEQQQPNVSELSQKFKQSEYDNSAMETLADIATKQVKLEKNSVAKNVASQLLKLATKNEYQNDGLRDPNSYISNNKDVNEMMVKPEENKNCTICSKSFSKPSQLRLHMNIHYLERPFRCDSCSVSFRTKGHLQKHERSASHHNKLSSSPTLSSQEPRPFKCSDCNIAFRIHGHLAKHLRSKMHIMKLECLAKIPFGLYAELERSNSLLTEINTTDGDQCLESLKMLAKKVFLNDPNKLNQLGPSTTECIDADS